MYSDMSFIAFLFTLAGVIYVANLKLRGQYFMTIANVCWLIYAVNTNQLFLGIQSFVMLLITIFGLYIWSKNKMKF